ncbi:hypothetical protein BLS_009320 [Venturia inaequalis]|uniref:BAG domain-containing protein n=1 Tax=Venturia inaequalis TaxID=5025 RepID=A0A8H3VNJ6_VENIN|nr:hypothetical protein BLS_009320 [Venturia inaequalis]KAE9991636.1 hypothetical protein EG327_011257 [Venturia inaequalis]RDI82145.1 hypothetical protein Vi05172_g7861 [Venturia inaequalis]
MFQHGDPQKNPPPSTKKKSSIVAASILKGLPESLKSFFESEQADPDTALSLTALQKYMHQSFDRLSKHIHQYPYQSDKHDNHSSTDNFYNTLRQLILQLQATEATLIAATLLTFILAVSLSMSWSSRFPTWPSPFGRRNSNKKPGEVSDSDFSYITAEDLARSENEQTAKNAAFKPSHNRDTDVLILKNKRMNYPVHFPAHSIDRDELTIGEIRAAAAKKLEIPVADMDRIKMLWKGRQFKDDNKTARQEGLRSDAESEIMLTVGEHVPKDDESSGSDGEDETTVQGGKKKRRNRKSKKSKKKETDTSTNSARDSANVNPDATYFPNAAPPPKSGTSTPKPQAAPQTAIQKLDALASKFHTAFVPDCIQFLNHPPAEKSKREFEHKKLTETILAQILIKLDSVETEGDQEARQRRKDLVRETQNMLNKLDEVVKA